MEYFKIVLNKPQAIYYSGEHLNGCLNIRLNNRLKINSVLLTIKGFARVHWTEKHANYKTNRIHHFKANETYLNLDLIFLAKKNTDDLYLEPGDISYPFDVHLPTNSATSFEHSLGQVRYFIKGTIDIPWAFNKHTQKSFTVISPLDLNKDSILRQPCTVSAQKVLCCGPFKSDPISASFNLFKGEPIYFSAIVDNKSSREIKEMSINLVQIVKFYAKTKKKISYRNVASAVYPKIIAAKSVVNWQNVGLIIPSVCSSSNGNCRIIEISYEAILNFGASGITLSTDLKIPIKIGTVPLRNSIELNESSLNDSYDDLPPSYEASFFGSNGLPIETNETRDEYLETDANSFKPFYPYFKKNQT